MPRSDRRRTSRAQSWRCPTVSISTILSALTLAVFVLARAEAREPEVGTPLTQSQLVAGFLDSYLLPDSVLAEVANAERDTATAALLAAPDLSLQQRASLGREGSMASLKASLDLALIDPTRSLDVALAFNGSTMTNVEVLEERRSALRSFLALLVRLEHAEDTSAQLQDVLTTVRRVRPSWLSADVRSEEVRLDELEAATDARFALTDLETVERQTRDLRRDVAKASGMRSAQTRPILRDLRGFRVPTSDATVVDDETTLRACVYASVPVQRARLLAQWRNLTRDRDRSASLPSLTLRLEGALESIGAPGPASGSASLSLGMRIPTWQGMTGALDVSGSLAGAEQELSLGWPNRYRDPPPGTVVDVEAEVAAAADQANRDLLEDLATLADLRFKFSAVEALQLRMEPVWRSRAQGDDLAAIEAAHQRLAASMKRIDLEASIRLYRLDVAYVCQQLAPLTIAP